MVKIMTKKLIDIIEDTDKGINTEQLAQKPVKGEDNHEREQSE